MKIDRLLSITIMLINRPLVTAKELSERFEVSIRTIYRDIDAISAAGIPVTSYQGKKGGFCLIDNYRIDRQILSLNDMTSILTALKGVNTSLDDNEIKDTIEKIESLVPHDKVADVQRKFNQVIIDLSPWEGGEQKNKFQKVHVAISEYRLISFEYRNLLGQETTREVEPMSLILKGYTWYVYGFCRKRDEFRLFRLSRMRRIGTTGRIFAVRNNPFSESDLFKSDKRKPVQMRLRFAPSAKGRVEELFNESPKTVDELGRVTVDVNFPEDEWVYSTLLSYGPDCEILSPVHIREIIKKRLGEALSFY